MKRNCLVFARLRAVAFVLALFSCVVCSRYLQAADANSNVQLDVKRAGPRAVENLTERAIARDYRAAWNGMAKALETNAIAPLDGPFTGQAKEWLSQSVTSQQKSGLSRRYADQSHKLEAVFYAPEGDVIELHDTTDYQLQMLDGGKVVSEEHVTAHYVVLMTPSADRWLVRQLQSVPQF
jgi:hypothetical protein